jgi:GT2 family glycosyltransferase
MSKVYIVLLNWNGWRDTIHCLESVLRSHYTNFRVVVCDNQSTDGSMEKIRHWAVGEFPVDEEIHPELRHYLFPPVGKPLPFVHYTREEAEQGGKAQDWKVPLVLIDNGSNGGYSAGNNVGIRFALANGADYIWLLNNDTVINSNTIKELVYRMESDTEIGLAGAVIYDASDPKQLQTYGGGIVSSVLGVDRFIHTPGVIHYVSGTSLFIKQEVLEQIGLLDDRFFFYWEDVDFSRRALEAGWKLAVASNAVLYHKFSASVGSQSIKSDLFKAASLTRYFRKHRRYGWFIPVMVQLTGMIIKRIYRGQFDRIFPIIREVIKAVKDSRPVSQRVG